VLNTRVFITHTILPNVPEQKLKAISITLKVQSFCFLSNPLISSQPVRIMGTFLLHLLPPPLQHNFHYQKAAQKIYETQTLARSVNNIQCNVNCLSMNYVNIYICIYT